MRIPTAFGSSLSTIVALSIGLIACDRSESVGSVSAPSSVEAPEVEEPSTDIFEWSAGGLMTTAADLNEDGKDEWAVATADELRVVDSKGVVLAKAPLSGGIQVLNLARLGEANVLLVGTGLTVKRREALGRISIFRLQGADLVEEIVLDMEVMSQRHEIVALQQRRDGRLLIAYFKSRFLVEAHTAQKVGESWEMEPIGTFRMATAWGLGDVDGDGHEDIIVGRIYGDEGVEDGDAFWLKPDGTRVMIPTTRGVRSLHLADLDSDGKDEVYLGDGWHQHYKAQGQALLTQARFSDGAFQTRQLVEFPDELEFTVWEVFTPRFKPEALFVRTNTAFYHVTLAGAFGALASAAEDATINRAGEVLVLGPVPQVLDLTSK